jgi:chorismate dehydratase
MKQSEDTITKIGMVNYLNTAPIHEKWKKTVERSDWELVEAPPTVINSKLAEGQLDMGFVSSFEYGIHPENYKILSGLSISADGIVGSVFLFSHVPIDQLDREPVLLSSQSETSVGLVKIILEEFNGVHPEYSTGNVIDVADDDFKALMAIGDDALKIGEKSRFLYQYDLGDIWKRETGLPFVFAVCAVREEFCEQQPEMLTEIHQELLRCCKEGKDELQDICEVAAGRIPMSKDRCFQYLQAIEYDLGAQKRQALEKYFDYLVQRGDIGKNALPLKFFSNI